MNEETFGAQKSCIFDHYVASQTLDEDLKEPMKKVISIKVEVNEKKSSYLQKIKDTKELSEFEKENEFFKSNAIYDYFTGPKPKPKQVKNNNLID